MRIIDMGQNVPYDVGMAHMREAMARVDVDGPVLLLLEHAPVITTTRRGGMSHVVSPAHVLAACGLDHHETDRGGDVTFHGPGQLVGYPVLRLSDTSLGSDVVGYVHALEQAIITACVALGVNDAHHKTERDTSGNMLTGVWCRAPHISPVSCGLVQVEHNDAKLCALGVGIAGGVTRHGFALNVTTDLERYTQHIVPCGLSGRAPTSLERVLPKTPTMAAVKLAVTETLTPVFARHRPKQGAA